MSKPKLLILGRGRHGKDTVAEMLVDRLPLTFTSSSLAVAELLYNAWGKLIYKDVADCFNDRSNYRVMWYNFVCNYNREDKARLSKEILKISDIYVGMRDFEEYLASKPLFDFIFYVDASKRIDYIDETMKIKYCPKEMILIDNNGSKEDLSFQVKIAAELVEGKANLNKVF